MEGSLGEKLNKVIKDNWGNNSTKLREKPLKISPEKIVGREKRKKRQGKLRE